MPEHMLIRIFDFPALPVRFLLCTVYCDSGGGLGPMHHPRRMLSSSVAAVSLFLYDTVRVWVCVCVCVTQVPSDFVPMVSAHPMSGLPEQGSHPVLGGVASPGSPHMHHVPTAPGLTMLGRPESPAAAEGRMKKYRCV